MVCFTVYVFLLAATMLFHTGSSQSLRGTDNQILQEGRDLVIQANFILTFSLSLVAAQPLSPLNIASCVANNTLSQSLTWYNSTHPKDKVVSISPPTVYTNGALWSGTRRLATTTTCNYLCIKNQIKSCRLCGSRRRNDRHLDVFSFNSFFGKPPSKPTNTTKPANTTPGIKPTNTTNTTVTKPANTTGIKPTNTTNTTVVKPANTTTGIKPTNSTNTTVFKPGNTTGIIKPTNTTNTTVTKPANTTNTTTVVIPPNTTIFTIELYLVEGIIKLILPLLCPGLSGITSVIFTVTEQAL